MLKPISIKIILLSIVIALTLINCNKRTSPIIIGHRGAMGHVTENTLESVQKAMDLDVDGIEIDIFKCKSGELVVFHDKNLSRLTDSNGLIESLDLDSIKKIRLQKKYIIPTLTEVLDLIRGKVFLNIEKRLHRAERLRFLACFVSYATRFEYSHPSQWNTTFPGAYTKKQWVGNGC